MCNGSRMAFTGTADGVDATCGCDAVDEVDEDVVEDSDDDDDTDDVDNGAGAGDDAGAIVVRVGVGFGWGPLRKLSPAAGFTIRWKVAFVSSSARTFENGTESSSTRPL